MDSTTRLAIALRLAADQELVLQVQQLVDDLLPETVAVYREITGRDPSLPPLQIMVTAEGLEEKGKVGVHVPPSDGRAYSVLKVNPKSFDKPGFVRQVVRHELIHYVVYNGGQDTTHGALFHQMADKLGLPEPLRD